MRILTFGSGAGDDRHDVEQRLKQLEIFSKLTDKQIRKLAALFVRRRYQKGGLLINKGDTGLGMFLIESGRVEVFDERDGSRLTLATLDAGKTVGEMSLMDARPRSANVEALEDTECLLMTRESFNSLTRRDPEVLWGIVPLLVDRLRHADRRLAELDDAGRPTVQGPAEPPRTAFVEPTPAGAPAAEAASTTDASGGAGDREDDEEEEEKEDNDKKSDPSLPSSIVQLSTASFLLVSSAFVLGTQESFRILWSRDSLGKSVSRNEEVVSALTSSVENNMTDGSKRVFSAFQELLNSLMGLVDR